MVLNNEEYETFINLFTNVADWISINMSSTDKEIDQIKVNQKTNMGAILYILLQQNILKEFLVEKTYFDKTNILKAIEPLAADHNTQDAMATFNWAHANNKNRTDIINWNELLGSDALIVMTDERREIKNRVKRSIQ